MMKQSILCPAVFRHLKPAACDSCQSHYNLCKRNHFRVAFKLIPKWPNVLLLHELMAHFFIREYYKLHSIKFLIIFPAVSCGGIKSWFMAWEEKSPLIIPGPRYSFIFGRSL